MPTNIYQRSAMAAAIAACFPGAAFAAGVARVDFASGNVSAVAANGQTRALQKGSEIEVGETVSTQAGRAQLRFADGAYMSLQPQTEFKVEEFKFSGKGQGDDNIVMNLLKGGMRTITGLIGRNNRNAYRLKTDVATIGIRGTEYSVKYTNSIEVFVADGAVAVENQSGSFTVPGGSGVMVSNSQTPPQQTDQKPVLPPESPTQQEQEKQQQQVADPVNPIQESSPPVPPVVQLPLLTGTIEGHWAVSFAGGGAFSNLETLPAVPITLDASGAMTSFVSDMVEGMAFTTTVGTGTALRLGNDGIVAWGRWIGPGTTGGDGFFPINLGSPFEGPLHYVVGMPATNIPVSGTATYSMLGSSISISAGTASVVDSKLSLDFGTSSAFFHGQFNINGSPINTDPGGVPLTRSGAHMQQPGAPLFFSGPSIALQGFLAGDGASRAGMAFQFFAGSNVTGAIAYKKD